MPYEFDRRVFVSDFEATSFFFVFFQTRFDFCTLWCANWYAKLSFTPKIIGPQEIRIESEH